MTTTDPATGRGRDTSDELVEVRTVLSRAENARDRLVAIRDGHIDRWEYDHDLGTVTRRVLPDPDIDQMIVALDKVIGQLAEWRRTGRAPKRARGGTR